MTNKLNELFQICGINDFIFTYQKEGDNNYVDYSLEPEKKIVVNIPNSDDKELDILLGNKIEELKELFK
jgi:hypothetical protein